MSISQAKLNILKGKFVKTKESLVWGVRDKASKDIQERMDEARLQEMSLKHWSRIGLSIFSALLLAWQNWQVFEIVNKAFQNGRLVDLQLIFTALVAATLTETYFIMKIIVTYVFSSNDYTTKKT